MLSNDTGIYQLSHSAKPGYYYIGSTTKGFNRRFKSHKTKLISGTHSSTHLQNVIAKYGLDGLSMRVLTIATLESKDMLELEQKYIDDFLDCFPRKYLYNVTLTTRCITDDPVVKERQRIAATKNGNSLTNLKRMSTFNDDAELKQKRVDALKVSRCQSVMCYETGEVFESMSSAGNRLVELGLCVSKIGGYQCVSAIAISCQNPKLKAYGFHWQYTDKSKVSFNYEDEYFRWVNSGKTSSKSVECIESGKVFSSLTDAKHWLISTGLQKADIGFISKCARGAYNTAYGFHWRFVEHNESV